MHQPDAAALDPPASGAWVIIDSRSSMVAPETENLHGEFFWTLLSQVYTSLQL